MLKASKLISDLVLSSLLSNYKAYLPEKLQSQLRTQHFFTRKRIRHHVGRSLYRISVLETEGCSLKLKYLMELENLQVAPKQETFLTKAPLAKEATWVIQVSGETGIFLSHSDNEEMEFLTLQEALSFVSLIDGYYRLTRIDVSNPFKTLTKTLKMTSCLHNVYSSFILSRNSMLRNTDLSSRVAPSSLPLPGLPPEKGYTAAPPLRARPRESDPWGLHSRERVWQAKRGLERSPPGKSPVRRRRQARAGFGTPPGAGRRSGEEKGQPQKSRPRPGAARRRRTGVALQRREGGSRFAFQPPEFGNFAAR
uniref:Uncharacterized protein n=1 Tax=Sphaerodactylus townsendi TaxID=933632 RepID=A0ACB8F316_9SAUR